MNGESTPTEYSADRTGIDLHYAWSSTPVALYRCNECHALVLFPDTRAHLWWHSTLVTVKP